MSKRPLPLIRSLAIELRGEVVGKWRIKCPRAEMRDTDRGLTIKLSFDYPDGFKITGPIRSDHDEYRPHVLAAMVRILFRADA